MKITVMDIENKEFKKAFRGYEQDDVDEFLEDVAEDYEALYKDNSSLKERLAMLEEKLENYKQIEATINNTLLMAQNTADQVKNNTREEANIILKKANDTAQRIIDDAHTEVIKINEDYGRVKREFLTFKSKYKNFMETQLDIFKSLEEDFTKNFNISYTESMNNTSKSIESIEEVINNEIEEKDADENIEVTRISNSIEFIDDVDEE
ncbi:DivIVA domain-containing protein [Clostridium sp. DL1XJH146]